MMDNRILNINGTGDELLRGAIQLAYWQDGLLGTRETLATNWHVDEKYGFVAFAYAPYNFKDAAKFPVGLDSNGLFETVVRWLRSTESEEIACEGWDRNYVGDASTERGWRVYVGDWGHVGRYNSGVICAIKPAYMWYGK